MHFQLILGLTIASFSLAQASYSFLREEPQEELLMLFEITRHGARGGLHLEYFNTTWKRGELTYSGKRQHYLIGSEMQDLYLKTGLLSQTYNRNEIYVRATDVNRTIESAMSQLLGIYQQGGNSYLGLLENQTSSALPTINVTNEVLEEATAELGSNSLPYGYQPIPVHVQSWSLDSFQPSAYCPLTTIEKDRRSADPALDERLSTQYNSTIAKMSKALNMNLTGFGAADYADSLWGRYFDQQPMPEVFDAEFMDEIMLFYADYYNDTLAMNETTRRLFVTGMLGEVVTRFETRINQDLNGSNPDDILKFYFYSDHDDSTVTLCNAFNHSLPNYPPFASQVLFGLWKKGDALYVNLTINNVQVPLWGSCNGQLRCEFSKFIDLIKQISYYGNNEEYNTLCGINATIIEPITQQFTGRIMEAQIDINTYYIKSALLVLCFYLVMMIFVSLIWAITSVKKPDIKSEIADASKIEEKEDEVTLGADNNNTGDSETDG